MGGGQRSPRSGFGYLIGALTAFRNPERARMGSLERSVRMQIVEALEELGQRHDATEHLPLLGAQQDWSPQPEPVYRQAPVVPIDAMKKRMGGKVTLSFTVDEQGFVVHPTVAESTQPSLNDAALAMVKAFRYAPRFIDGNPVPTEGIEFTENFPFASATPGFERPNFARPPIRGFMNVDFNDISECANEVPDERVCAGIILGLK